MSTLLSMLCGRSRLVARGEARSRLAAKHASGEPTRAARMHSVVVHGEALLLSAAAKASPTGRQPMQPMLVVVLDLNQT